MAEIPLTELLKSKTQSEVALIMGVTQGAVHQMVKAGRDIRFTIKPGDNYSFYEIKKPKAKAA